MTTTLSIKTPAQGENWKVVRSGGLAGPTTVIWTTDTGETGKCWFGGGEDVKELWLSAPAKAVTLSDPTGATIDATALATAAAASAVETINPAAASVTRFDFTKPVDRWAPSRQIGLWKTNMWYGGDGTNWPDAASSRAGGEDMQTYSDAAYNGIEPFTFGDHGVTITARPNPLQTPLTPLLWTSGMLSTETSFRQAFGEFTFQDVRLDALTSGMWPGLWLLNEQGQEIDVAEVLGSDPGMLHFNAHNPGAGLNVAEGTFRVDPAKPHDIGIVWTPERLTWVVDGAVVYSAPNIGICKALYPIIDLAVGPRDGGWALQNTPAPGAVGAFTVLGIEVTRG